MAGVLVDVLLERLATLALDKIEKELKLVVGVKQEIRNLTQKLEAIRAVLEDAEQRQQTEASVKLWLNKLNDVAFDMDDVLDEWITKVLKHQLEKQERQGALVTTNKKVCFPHPFSCFRFGQVNYQLFLRHEISKKIEELNERLALIDQNKQSFNFQNNLRVVPEFSQRQKTTSLPNVKTFGRDTEKNLIVDKLLSESSEGSEVPLVIPIVGMGGMGKTSLANLVYNDDKIISHFGDMRIWVCVSDPFEEIKIAKAIVEGLGEDSTSNELEHLMKKIKNSIQGKKFLLVLDDVWSPNSDQWEELTKPLREGAKESRVLVTTRNENVVTLMKATTQMIPLKELGESFCLSLFYHSAGIDESNVSRDILDIGLQIVKRCNGLPLAAKTLGSLMRNKKKTHEWQAILNSKTWELKEVEHYVFQPLLLSYQDLGPAIRRCLLYCVLFSKDYMYDKNMLIELWMSQDYLGTNESKECEMTGQLYFNELVMRSFFQDVEEDSENGNIKCKVHDIVHDFLQYLSKSECLIIDFELDASKKKKVSNDKVRHLTLVHASASDLLVSANLNCEKLRSFTAIDSSSNPIDLVVGLTVQLKYLRTINLCRSSLAEIPKTISGLIHLRYLDLSQSYSLKELPSTIGSLYNLQTLRLVSCQGLGEIDVRRLINLRHLYVEGCDNLYFIKGIEKLTDLQTLDEFAVLRGDQGNKLEHLKDLNQLQGSLTIKPEVVNMVENAANFLNTIMVDKALLELKIDFKVGFSEEVDREIMNGLEPQPNLESLSIRWYKGSVFSTWLTSLHSLRVLSLSSCWACKTLPPLGKLASLESLEFRYLDGLEKLGDEFLGIEEGQTSSPSIFISFPRLRQFTIDSMYLWEEWKTVEEENSENITIMPCLSQFRIHQCQRLKALPDFLWKTPLQKLDISNSELLQNLYRQGTGEQRAKISHIPSINTME